MSNQRRLLEVKRNSEEANKDTRKGHEFWKGECKNEIRKFASKIEDQFINNC